jgi:tyrosine-protein phosphatase YwqE
LQGRAAVDIHAHVTREIADGIKEIEMKTIKILTGCKEQTRHPAAPLRRFDA